MAFAHLPPPGTILSLESLKKKVTFSDLHKTQPSAGQIIKVSEIVPEKTPVYQWFRIFDEIKLVFDEFRENECLSVLESLGNFPKQSALNFAESNIFGKVEFCQYLKKYQDTHKAKYLRCVDFLIKKSCLEQYSKLIDQKEHTDFTLKKFLFQQKNFIKCKRTLEYNSKVELDLEQEKESLKELTRLNKPFLSAGKTTYKNSKHILCITKKKKKNLQEKIEDKTQSIELQLSMSQSIWEKNLKVLCIGILKFSVMYSKKRKEMVQKYRFNSSKSLLFYVFSSWIGFAKLSKDKKICNQLASKALKMSKCLRIIQAWKYQISKPLRQQMFFLNINDYLKQRKQARLLISWKWFVSSKKLKNCMNILAEKYFSEKLKTIKFFELKSEVILTIGNRKRFQDLANGDQNQFSKDETIVSLKFQARTCLGKIYQKLSKVREEVFMLSQETAFIENSILHADFYTENTKNWKKWLLKKYKINNKLKF